MLAFLTDNLAAILICAVLLTVVVLIVVNLIRNKKKGKTSCGCGCEVCPSASLCHTSHKSGPK